MCGASSADPARAIERLRRFLKCVRSAGWVPGPVSGTESVERPWNLDVNRVAILDASLLRSSVCLCLAMPGYATTVVPLSFEQLVNESQSVVYGRVVGRARAVDRRSPLHRERRDGRDPARHEGQRARIDRVHRAGRPGRPLPERDSRRAELRAGRSGGVLPDGQGRAAAGHDRADAGHLPRPARCRLRRDAGRAAGGRTAPGRIVRGDVRRKPVSLAAFEGTVRATLRLAQGRPERSRGTVAGAR